MQVDLPEHFEAVKIVHEIKCLAELMLVDGLENSRLEKIRDYSSKIVELLDKELISEGDNGELIRE